MSSWSQDLLRDLWSRPGESQSDPCMEEEAESCLRVPWQFLMLFWLWFDVILITICYGCGLLLFKQSLIVFTDWERSVLVDKLARCFLLIQLKIAIGWATNNLLANVLSNGAVGLPMSLTGYSNKSVDAPLWVLMGFVEQWCLQTLSFSVIAVSSPYMGKPPPYVDVGHLLELVWYWIYSFSGRSLGVERIAGGYI